MSIDICISPYFQIVLYISESKRIEMKLENDNGCQASHCSVACAHHLTRFECLRIQQKTYFLNIRTAFYLLLYLCKYF